MMIFKGTVRCINCGKNPIICDLGWLYICPQCVINGDGVSSVLWPDPESFAFWQRLRNFGRKKRNRERARRVAIQKKRA